MWAVGRWPCELWQAPAICTWVAGAHSWGLSGIGPNLSLESGRGVAWGRMCDLTVMADTAGTCAEVMAGVKRTRVEAMASIDSGHSKVMVSNDSNCTRVMVSAKGSRVLMVLTCLVRLERDQALSLVAKLWRVRRGLEDGHSGHGAGVRAMEDHLLLLAMERVWCQSCNSWGYGKVELRVLSAVWCCKGMTACPEYSMPCSTWASK